MQLGIFSDVLPGTSPAEVAASARKAGFATVQHSPWAAATADGRRHSARDWADAYLAEGIGVCGVAGYTNILHPDPARREQNLRGLEELLRQSAELAWPCVATETGTFATSSDWHFDPANRTDHAWAELERVTERLVRVAEAANTVLLLEPYVVNVCWSPQLARRLVTAFRSPHLGLVMDPTNWLEAGELEPDAMAQVISAGFLAERGLYRLAHAKDVAPPDDGGRWPSLPAPGKGTLDYPLFLDLLRRDGYDGAFVLEHLSAAEVESSTDFVRRHLDLATNRSSHEPGSDLP